MPRRPSSALARPVHLGLGVLAVAALAGLALQIGLMQHGRDQGIYSVAALSMLDGGAPYRDVWDFKPPGIYFVYATGHALFGRSPHAVRAIEVLSLLSMLGGFALLSRRAVGHAAVGLVAGIVALACHLVLDFWDTAQPESFAGPLVVWGTWLALVRAPGRAHVQAALWCGCAALFALAGAMKPPLAGGALVAYAAVALRLRGEARAGSQARAALCFAAGGGLVVAALAVHLAASGVWSEFRSIFFEFVPRYTGIQFSWSALPALVGRSISSWPVGGHAFLWLGMLALLVPGLGRTRDQREAQALVAGVAALQLVGIAAQAKFFPYHYGALLPLTSLLGVWGYARLWPLPRARWGLVLVLALGVHWLASQPRTLERSRLRWVALVDAEQRVQLNDFLHSGYDVDAGANRSAAEWIAAHTPPDEPIHVWGFEPILYMAAERRPASRYVYNVAQRASWGRERARAELMSDLAAHPPSVIVSVQGDALAHVTDNQLDSAAALQGFAALRQLVREQYVLAAVSGDLSIFERRDLHARRAAATGSTADD